MSSKLSIQNKKDAIPTRFPSTAVSAWHMAPQVSRHLESSSGYGRILPTGDLHWGCSLVSAWRRVTALVEKLTAACPRMWLAVEPCYADVFCPTTSACHHLSNRGDECRGSTVGCSETVQADPLTTYAIARVSREIPKKSRHLTARVVHPFARNPRSSRMRSCTHIWKEAFACCRHRTVSPRSHPSSV